MNFRLCSNCPSIDGKNVLSCPCVLAVTRGEGGVGRMDGTWRTMQPPPARVGVRTSHQSALEPGGLEILDPGPPNHLIHWPLYRRAANKEEEVHSNYTRGEKQAYYRSRIHERTIVEVLLVELTVNSKEENSSDFCPNYNQEICLRASVVSKERTKTASNCGIKKGEEN